MRLVFVNNTHPLTPHVSGMRLYFFARALAKRGHQVVLLTGMPPADTSGTVDAAATLQRLPEWDWSEPAVVAVRPAEMPLTRAIRGSRLHPIFRRLVTAWLFVWHGGVLADWSSAARPVAAQLAEHFQPDLVWGTFGNTDNLALARWTARRAGCPWVLDVKDNWDAYIPAGLRRLMAFRLRGAAGATSNAGLHEAVARKWTGMYPRSSRVVYSGVADAFYDAPVISSAQATRKLLLVGSTYSDVVLGEFLAGVAAWVNTLGPDEHARFEFHYLGSDHRRVREAVRACGLESVSVVRGQAPLAELAGLARNAFCCAYLWLPSTFHHKVLELLVAGNPVIAYPGEHRESLTLAARCTTPLHPCGSGKEIAEALHSAWIRERVPRSGGEKLPPWRWEDFAGELESCFRHAIAQSLATEPRHSTGNEIGRRS